MRSIVWGAASIVFVVVVLFVMLILKADVGDIIFAMLSGSIVGVVASIFALTKGVGGQRAAYLIFSAIIASAVSWVFGLILLKITQVNLFSITALAFDLLVGIVGAAAYCYFLIDAYFEKYKAN